MEPSECPGYSPILFHNPLATFTTRGCVNKCSFCAVPKIEGEFLELENWRPAPVVCDNNLTAASKGHIRRVVDSLKLFPYVDFNQGFEARRFTPDLADMFGELKCHIRFAFDHWGAEQYVKDAIDLCQQRATKDITIFVLIGFKDTPEEAQAKLEEVRSWGVLPTPMRFQPLDAKRKNSYTPPLWTEYELHRMMRYYSRLNYFEHIPYKDFQGPEYLNNQQVMELNF